MHSNFKHSRRAGFNMVELLIVIAIISILATLMVPQVSMVLERAMQTNCSVKMKHHGAAIFAEDADNPNKDFYGFVIACIPGYNDVKPPIDEFLSYVGNFNSLSELKDSEVMLCPAADKRKNFKDTTTFAATRFLIGRPSANRAAFPLTKLNSPANPSGTCLMVCAGTVNPQTGLAFWFNTDGFGWYPPLLPHRGQTWVSIGGGKGYYPSGRSNVLFFDGSVKGMQGDLAGTDPSKIPLYRPPVNVRAHWNTFWLGE